MKFKLALITVFMAAALSAQNQHDPTGYTDTPFLPGSKWRVHDDARPRPLVITPGTFSTSEIPGQPPSDAVVLFDVSPERAAPYRGGIDTRVSSESFFTHSSPGGRRGALGQS